MKTEHTEKCLTARAKERADLAAYTEKWPNFCRECGAQGGSSHRENQAPLGSGECWLEEIYDSCPHCVEKLVCPRCGKHSISLLGRICSWLRITKLFGLHFRVRNNFEDCDDEPMKCFACNWTENSAGAPEVLNPSECGCFEDALETEQEKERTLFRPLDGQY